MNLRLPTLTLTSLIFGACNSRPPDIETGGETGFMCFVAGTRVWTAQGQKCIEDIVPGDRVWSWDTQANQPVLRTVRECIVGASQETIRLQAGEQVITGVTDEHPLWVPTVQAWLTAGTLLEGQEVLCWLGHHEARALPLYAPQRTRHEQPVNVFTLSVEGPEHNFFAEGILVHNKQPMLECWAFKQAETSHDFGPISVGTTASFTVFLDVTENERCDWIELSQRQLTIRLDDPIGGFEMKTLTYDLLEVGTQTLQWPVTFTPSAAQAYEAQVLFDLSDNQEVALARPRSVQIFGEGKPAE